MASDRKRIALIIPGGIGTGRNNIGIPVLEQQVTLLAREFEIVLFSLFKVNDDYHPKGFDVVSIPGSNSFFKAIALFRQFRKANKQKRFDAVHGMWAVPSGFLAVWIGKFFRIRSIVSVLGGDAVSLPSIGYGQLQSPLQKAMVRWVLYEANIVTALTKYLVVNLKREGINRNDIQIIPWGVDPDLFPFKPLEVAEPVKFLHIANLSDVKDPITLLKAFKLIADKIACALTIIGEGPLQSQLEEYIKLHQLNAIIRPPVPYRALPPYYNNAMILLHTSLSEGQSEVVTEAMSSGVVVCGTSVGLLFDAPDCCVAVTVKDHVGLAESVIGLLEDRERLIAIRDRAHAWTLNHSIHWTVEEIAKLYRENGLRKA